MSDAYIKDEFGFVEPHFLRVDEDDYSKGYYVSSLVWQNKGSGWYRGIEFGSAEALDNLVYALLDAKAKARHRVLAYEDDSFMAIRNGDMSGEPKLQEGGTMYQCPDCGTPIPRNSWARYNQGRPKYCMNCGCKFKEYGRHVGTCGECEHYADAHCGKLDCYMKPDSIVCEWKERKDGGEARRIARGVGGFEA